MLTNNIKIISPRNNSGLWSNIISNIKNNGTTILTTTNINLFKKEYMLIIVEFLNGIIFSKKRISFIIWICFKLVYSNIRNLSLTYLRGLEVSELEEEDMPVM
jgi:hypothetical protein